MPAVQRGNTRPPETSVKTLRAKGIALCVSRGCEEVPLLCMNYMEGGICHVTGLECLLGTSYEPNRDCALQGNFDVWITYDDRILISDIGSPSPEPKRSVALGVEKELASQIAVLAARKALGQITTTQQRCRRCGSVYWITEHESATPKLGRRYFCPKCIEGIGEIDVPDYWCG